MSEPVNEKPIEPEQNANNTNTESNVEEEEESNSNEEEEEEKSNSNEEDEDEDEDEEEEEDEDEDEEEEEDEEVQSGVQISSSEDNAPNVIELGDHLQIDYKKGRLIGIVYYRDGDHIAIKPDGISNILYEFNVTQTETEEEFDEEDGITEIGYIKKRLVDSFIEQNGLQVDHIIHTFDKEGELYNIYKITKIDIENDSITIVNYKPKEPKEEEPKEEEPEEPEEPEDEIIVDFNFTGIPYDLPFKIISINGFAQVKNSEQFVPKEEEEEEEEEGIVFVGIIEIMKPVIFKEVASFLQRIPDNLQKIDALNDFVATLDAKKQQDPIAIREQRILVETFFNLKQSTILYGEDDSIELKPTSAETLSELIATATIPLGRPVVDVVKKVYYPIINKKEKRQKKDKKDKDKDQEEDEEEVDLESLGDTSGLRFTYFKAELKSIIDNRSNVVSCVQSNSTLIKEWIDQQSFATNYLSTWYPTEVSELDNVWEPILDSEFFRREPPILQDGTTNIENNNIPGYVANYDENIPSTIDKVPFGIEVALSTTYRKGVDNKKHQLINAERGAITSYILFPIKSSKYIGAKRSYSLAYNSARGKMPIKTMKMIFNEFGGPTEISGGANNIILLDNKGGTLGNIPLADYIEGMSIPALGLSDTYNTLINYGIDNMELNKSIADVLLKKIEVYKSHLVTSLATLREQIGELEESTNNPFIEDPLFLNNKNDIIVKDISEYERINPTLEKSDIGKVIFLMQKHPNLFQVVIGTDSTLIAKETMRLNHDEYILYHRINKIITHDQKNAGYRPKRNNCIHVPDFVSVKKIYDDSERFYHLLNFFKKYQGIRSENWINCKLCNEHLLCIHERLQLQAYLHPMDKPTIDKEILMSFSGGQFQGKFICRNCGQAIREIDFDNNMEFDDNGKPKSGRAVLIDEDAIFNEKLKDLLTPIKPSEKSELNISESDMECYNIIRELSESIGINIDKPSYQFIISNVTNHISSLGTEDSYLEQQKGKKSYPSFNTIISYNKIVACATFLLVDIQTKIPSYKVYTKLQGCASPGFDGYPIDLDDTNKQGIIYMTCAIQALAQKYTSDVDNAWTQSKIKLAIQKDKNNNTMSLMVFIEKTIKKYITSSVFQNKLQEKRAYIIEMIEQHKNKSNNDMIPASFLPEQFILSPDDMAKDAVIPEVASHMNNGHKSLVKMWIRIAHMNAKSNAFLVRGSPFSESTCCVSSITNPVEYFKSDKLPVLKTRALVPNNQGHMLLTHFTPRESESNVIEPDKELYHRLFLKYCFEGPRKGYAHEPGLTNICIWCEFQFPMNPSFMTTTEIDTNGKAALYEKMGDTLNKDSFVELLDVIHRVNAVEKLPKIRLTPIMEVIENFSRIDPPPFHQKHVAKSEIKTWNVLLTTTFNGLSTLLDKPTITTQMIDNELGVISDLSYLLKESVKKYIPDNYTNGIESLTWINFFQVLQTYIIVPLQRVISQFNTLSLNVSHELEDELSDMHVNDFIIPFLNADVEILKKLNVSNKLFDYEKNIKVEDIHKKLPFAILKIGHFLKQMKQIMVYKDKISPALIIGKTKTLKYIKQILLYGPLAELLDSSITHDYVRGKKDDMRISMELIHSCVQSYLFKYTKEKLSFDAKGIKELIEIHNEKERVSVVSAFNVLSDEARTVELINKRHGLGKWAVGGTSVIWKYDKKYFDLERSKQVEAGTLTIPGSDDVVLLHEMEISDAEKEERQEKLDQGYDVSQNQDGEGDE